MENCVLWVGLPGGIWCGLLCGAHWGYQWGLRLVAAAATAVAVLAAARAWHAREPEPQPEAVDAARLSPAHRQREVWGAASGAEPTRPPFYPAGYHIWIRGAGGNPDHLVGVRDQLSLAQELQKRTAEELSESGHRSCVFVRRGR